MNMNLMRIITAIFVRVPIQFIFSMDPSTYYSTTDCLSVDVDPSFKIQNNVAPKMKMT